MIGHPTADPALEPEPAPLLDLAHLAQFADDGILDYVEIMDEALEEVPEHIEELALLLETADAAAIKSLAHRMRGTLSAFGCLAISGKLLEIESLSTGPSGPPPAEAAGELRALWRLTRPALDAWVRQNAG